MGNVARLQQNFSTSRKNKPFRENAPIKKFFLLRNELQAILAVSNI